MGRFKIILIATLVVAMVLLPDVMLDIFHTLLELVMHFGHTLFEILEVTLDLLVEHAFHTDLHQTQIVVFYILFSFVSYWFWRAWRAWPRIYAGWKEKLALAKAEQTAQLVSYWESLGRFRTLKVTVILLMIIFVVGFFSF